MAGTVRAGLFALACNLDTLLLALLYALRGWRASRRETAVLALLTTAATVLSLALGAAARGLWWVDKVGCGALMGLGLWTVLGSLRGETGRDRPAPSGLRQTAALGGVLALNNAGAGVAEGAAGLSLWWGGGANLAATVVCLCLGARLAGVLPAREAERWLEPISGALLMLLGLLELLE